MKPTKRRREKSLFGWLESFKDKTVCARILARLDRLILGNFGDCKALGTGMHELRFHFGPGYRVYYGRDGATLVILLAGGDKGSQSRDIAKARSYWDDYLRRKSNEALG